MTNRVDLERASSLVAGLGSAPPRVDPESNQFSFPIKGGAEVLIAAGRAIDDDGIALEDLGIRRPSLDEVFLSLTGHGARSNGTGEMSGSGATDG